MIDEPIYYNYVFVSIACKSSICYSEYEMLIFFFFFKFNAQIEKMILRGNETKQNKNNTESQTYRAAKLKKENCSGVLEVSK